MPPQRSSVAAGARVPPVNPFRSSPTERYLPVGSRLTILLSNSPFGSPRGCRAVSGVVRGFAPRSRSEADVELCQITTWFQDEPFDELETLEPGFSALFRINLAGSLRQTFARLADPSTSGRLAVTAKELPPARCEDCGADVRGCVFCPNCGRRAAVGLAGPRPGRRPLQGGAGVCPGCWSTPPRRGAFCALCGFDYELARQIAAELTGVAVTLELQEGGRRQGAWTATIARAALQRRHPGGPVQVYAQVGDLIAPDGSALPSDFATIVALGGSSNPRTVLADVAAHAAVRASEPLRRCRACAQRNRQRTPYVRGLCCTGCGRRTRIVAHSSELRRMRAKPPLRVVEHTCGGRFVEATHEHCGTCGEALADYQPGSGRLASLR